MSKFLIVAYDEDAHRAFERVLQDRGHTVVEAPDGAAALDLLERQPDVTVVIAADGTAGPIGRALALTICAEDRFSHVSVVRVGDGGPAQLERLLGC